MGIALSGWFIYNQFCPTEEFKSGFKSVFQLFFPLICLVTGWKNIRYKGKSIEEVVPADLQCSELEASVAKAKETMSDFLKEVDKGIDGAYIKFPLQSEDGPIEHIWAYVHFYRNELFNVSLANEPIDDSEDYDGRQDVGIDQVQDWQIIDSDGSIRGAYSLIALFEYWGNQGKDLSPLMKLQKSQLTYAK
ncbi:DUF2314 domain-containing protein [Rubritalea profundi]|nr:DUF2314 domain-containing protein [Rubritalea profundi]